MMIVNKKLVYTSLIILIFIITILVSSIKYNSLGIGEKAVSATPQSTYHVFVDIEISRLYVFKDGVLEEEFKCAGGKLASPSPIGTWRIVQKGKWGEGFGGSWMGFDVPWGQFGIHGTDEPHSIGWESSHGCIRMYNEQVAELYKKLPIGTRVTIYNGVYKDFGDGFRSLKSGMYGADVKQIQQRLKDLGFFNGNPNGKFGIETETAIKNYCRANNLYVQKTISIELQKHMGFELID